MDIKSFKVAHLSEVQHHYHPHLGLNEIIEKIVRKQHQKGSSDKFCYDLFPCMNEQPINNHVLFIAPPDGVRGSELLRDAGDAETCP